MAKLKGAYNNERRTKGEVERVGRKSHIENEKRKEGEGDKRKGRKGEGGREGGKEGRREEEKKKVRGEK